MFLKLLISQVLGFTFGLVKNNFLDSSIVVFLYHDVSANPSEFSRMYNLNVSPKLFNFQIEFIKKNFNIISPDELLQSRIPPKAVLITFDDGFRSYFKNAIPILERYEVPSIIFLNMAPIKGAIFWSGLITYLCEKDEQFRKYLKSSLSNTTNQGPLFISCGRKIVDSYIRKTGKSFEKEVSRFIGEFATEKDLVEASTNPLVFYGNHLYNHDVPVLLSNEELLSSYLENNVELKKYPNYINMFSFPFGQPGTCYSDEQVNLLFQKGAKKIFSSHGIINSDASSYLHRIPLSSFNDSTAKIWFDIFQRSFRTWFDFTKKV